MAKKTLTRLRPTFDRVLIEREKEQELTKGGIVIPDVSVSKPNQGRIVDMGPGVPDRNGHGVYIGVPQLFGVGDIVQVGQYAGIEMVIDDRHFVLCKMDEIISIVELVEVEDLNESTPDPAFVEGLNG
jgi:chaperonin GroES